MKLCLKFWGRRHPKTSLCCASFSSFTVTTALGWTKMTGSQKNVSIFGTLFSCKFHGFWQHVRVNIPWFIPSLLFEIVTCSNLFGIGKDQRKTGNRTPYLRQSFYSLFSTICKAWCLKLFATLQFYEELADTGWPEKKKKKIIIPFSQPSRKSPIYSRASGIKGLGREKTGRTNGLTIPFTGALA